MRVTRPSFEKIFSLINHSAFRKSPVKILSRVIRWEIVRIRNKPLRFIYDNDLSVLLYPNDGSARLVFYFDYQEPHEFEFLNRYLDKSMFCIDIGANIGMYSLFMAKRTDHVLAFEPQNVAMSRLMENININQISNITAEEIALSDQSEKLALKIDKADSSRSCTTKYLNGNGDEYIVDATCLDDYIVNNPINRIDFIKIDTEGFEKNIVYGANKSLKKYRPVVEIELIQNFHNVTDASIFEIKEFFNSLEYTFFYIQPGTSKLKQGEGWNSIVIPNEKIKEIQARGLMG